MIQLFNHHLVLASGVTIRLGDHIWTFSASFLIYLLIAAIVGIVAEFVVGWRLPLGIVGAILAGVIGVWLMTQVIVITGFNDVNFDGVPLIRAVVGAIILVTIWHALTYRSWQSRRRYYNRE